MGYALKVVDQPVNESYGHVDALSAYMRHSGLTQAEVSRLLGYSSSAISQYLNKKYDKGDLQKLNIAVADLLTAEALAARYQMKTAQVVLTKQMKECLGAIDCVKKLQAAGEKTFGVITGEAGIGKSRALEEYVRQNRTQSLLVICDPTKRSPTKFIQHLWRHLPGLPKDGRLSNSAVLMDDIIEYYQGKKKLILIDEGQFLEMETNEAVRSIQDQTGLGFVLSGTFKIEQEIGLRGRIPENAQLYSRAGVHCELTAKISPEDLTAMVGLYGVQDAKIIEWLLPRCNQPGKRYRFVSIILNLAHSLSVDRDVPLDLQAVENAERMMRPRR
jgi:DNA transposition AAA+ family ATPase